MRQKNLVVQLFGVAFLCLSVTQTGSASRKEELERLAELAVERSAERIAERAVEKALESGNSSSATETIRASHSSVRKHDSTYQLPGSVYTPAMRKEYERIMKEKEAGELAVAQIMRGRLFKRAIDDNYQYKAPSPLREYNNNYPYGLNSHHESAGVNHEAPGKISLHPMTVSEVRQLYPVVAYQNIPRDQSVQLDKDKEIYSLNLQPKLILYHFMKLLKVNQDVPTMHYYHQSPAVQSVRPIYLYPKIEMHKQTHDQTSTY